MNRYLSPVVRRLVLGGALLAASLVAFLPQTPSVRAAEPIARVMLLAQADAKADAKAAAESARDASREATRAAREAAASAKSAAREARRMAADADNDTDTDSYDDGTPRKHRRGITVGIGGVDRDYDSFDQFLDRDPGLAALVLGIVFIVFLTPILLIGLIIWYKMRKTRLQNETMLKLAEKGIVPAGEAMQAVGDNRVGQVLNAAAAQAPLAEQARAWRQQSAWSDLRKGVLMGTVGLGITLYSILDDQSPNWLGLVLLFVGIGYCVLWYFEDQQVTAARLTSRGGPAGPGDIQN